MARNQKKSLSYFPFDVDFFSDDKIQLVSARFGIKGEIVAIKLLCKIYSTNGYYYQWGEDEALLFAKGVGEGVQHSLVNDIVHELVKRGFFDKDIFDRFKILTSNGIQQRYITISKQLKRDVEIMEKINCTNLHALKNSLQIDNSGKIQEKILNPPEKSPIFLEEMTQRKRKESKEKESKGEEIKNISTRDPVWIEKVCVAYRTTEKQLLDFCEDWIVKKEVELLFGRYPPKACVAFMLRDFCDKKDALPNQTKTSIKTNDPYIEWEKNKSYGS